MCDLKFNAARETSIVNVRLTAFAILQVKMKSVFPRNSLPTALISRMCQQSFGPKALGVLMDTASAEHVKIPSLHVPYNV